eukprot:5606594-Pyramimonas_sp.AAC.1
MIEAAVLQTFKTDFPGEWRTEGLMSVVCALVRSEVGGIGGPPEDAVDVYLNAQALRVEGHQHCEGLPVSHLPLTRSTARLISVFSIFTQEYALVD